MSQILCSDWLLEWARWNYVARLGLPAVFHKKNFPKCESHIIDPLSTRLFMQSRWLDIFFFFCESIDLMTATISIHKHAKKEQGQYPAILTLHLVNNPYLSKMFPFPLPSHTCMQPIFLFL